MGDGEDTLGSDDFKKRRQRQVTQYPDGQVPLEEIANVKAMLAESPDNLVLKEWLAVKLYGANLLNEAIEILLELVDLDHNLENTHYYLGNALYKMDRLEEALSSWRYVARMTPGSVRGQKAKARIEKVKEELR